MVTRSIVGRFLILAVLVVSLGVIAQAALIISREPGRTAAKTDAARGVAAVASLATTPANAATPDQSPAVAAAQAPAQAPEAAPVRVVYPGPLGDAPAPVRKITDAAPASPLVTTPVVPVATAAVQSPALSPAAAPAVSAAPQATAALDPAPAPAAATAPVLVAAAESDTQPAASDTGAGHGVNLNNASIDALNHLGGGHIGQTIVKHRPYHSVEDLVKKRVVRRSVYEQIKNQVAAD